MQAGISNESVRITKSPLDTETNGLQIRVEQPLNEEKPIRYDKRELVEDIWDGIGRDNHNCV